MSVDEDDSKDESDGNKDEDTGIKESKTKTYAKRCALLSLFCCFMFFNFVEFLLLYRHAQNLLQP